MSDSFYQMQENQFEMKNGKDEKAPLHYATTFTCFILIMNLHFWSTKKAVHARIHKWRQVFVVVIISCRYCASVFSSVRSIQSSCALNIRLIWLARNTREEEKQSFPWKYSFRKRAWDMSALLEWKTCPYSRLSNLYTSPT